MAPKYRQLHTKVLDSFDFNEMPDDFTRLVWLLLPLILDSEGRGIANASWIRSRMFPLRNDISDAQLRSSFIWFLERKMVIEYQASGYNYFYVPTFKNYQVHTEREAKSNLPAPELVQSYSGVTQELIQTNSTTYESASVNESVSLSNKTIFSIRDAEHAYLRVTEFASVPGGMMPRMENILDLLQHYGWDETINRLTRAKENWVSQHNQKNGANYKLTNPAWIDYAITGEFVGAPPEIKPVEIKMTDEEYAEYNKKMNEARI